MDVDAGWLANEVSEAKQKLDALELEETGAQLAYEEASGDDILAAEDAVYALRYEYHRTLGRKQAYEEVLSAITKA